MKLLKYILALVLLTPMGAWAGLNLPEPQVLLAKAQQNRIALREVILDIDMNIPEMRDQGTFEKYFYLMDELTQLSAKFDLEQFYPQIVSRLALRMTGNGMRWLDSTKDPSERLQYYVQWMDADTLNRLLDNMNYQLALVKDKNLLAVMAKNVESILPLVDARAEGQTQLMAGYRRLVTDVAIVILKDKNLPSAEVQFWIGKLLMSSALSEYVELLNQDIYQMTVETKEVGREYLSRLLLLNVQLAKLTDAVPTWLTNSVGDAIVELLLRSIRFELTLSVQQFTQAVEVLNVRQTLSLIQQWQVQEKLPSESYAVLYLDYAKVLVARGLKLGLNKDTEELQKWLGRTAAPIMAKKFDLEGNYQVVNEKGEKWYFTIAYARETMLVAALGTETGSLYKTFFNISYSAGANAFIASEREPDTDRDMNPPLKFTINEKGEITIWDPFIREGLRILKGTKVQSFTDMWETFKGPIGEADGTYEGEIYLPSGTKMNVKIIVTSFNGYTLGRLDGERVTIDFNIGTRGTDGVLILTSGRNHGASWMQIRGHLTPEGLKAYVIVGGKGQSTACTTLKRIANF
ncbi:hypothetical protein [Bdellovibrio bacteriovorus]|uniref:hypothetical protein n=1 Tax=Bdellovibrio bacteriovorus TaxID=959 RepID=UPI0035A97C63